MLRRIKLIIYRYDYYLKWILKLENLHGRRMLTTQNQILQNIDENHLSKELEIAKFRNYGRENFSGLIPYEVNLERFLENSSMFFSIKLPQEISEFFLRKDCAHYYFISEAPLKNEIIDFLTTHGPENNFIANHREINKLYKRWIFQKYENEKYHLAKTIANLIERNFQHQSFYSVLLYGIIVTYEEKLYDPIKGLELYERAKDILNNCDIESELKNKILYLISLLTGFLFLKENEFSKALKTFEKSLDYNKFGATAIFYSSLSAKLLNDLDLSFDYLNEVIEFDRAKFQYAINYSHLGLFNFFYENAITYNIFVEESFAELLPDIDFMIKSLHSGDQNSMVVTYSKIIDLDSLRIKNFFNEAIEREISFLKQALNQYKNKKTGLIRIVEQIFRDKFTSLIEYIRHLIETHYYEQIKESVEVFDTQIEQNNNQLKLIKEEMESAGSKIKSGLNDANEYLDKIIEEKKEQIKQHIENLENNPKYNPSQVLFNSIVFSIGLALAVILITGLITSFFGSPDASGSTKIALKTSLAWGGITFVIGVFISVFTALSTFWEKAKVKKELTDKLSSVGESEESEREIIKEDSEKRAKAYAQKYQDRIKAQEKIIANFKKERKQHYEYQFSAARKEIDTYITPLNELLENEEEK